MMGSAKDTHTALTTMPHSTTTVSAAASVSLAPFLSCCPFRLATIADTDTLTAVNRARPMNLGWVVRPTAATA